MSSPLANSPEALWQEQLRALVTGHFGAARKRVDSVYRQHFASLPVVIGRHWRYKRDVPKDLANIPRNLWQLARQLSGGKNSPPARALSQKEQAVMQIIVEQLLAMSQLEAGIIAHIQQHPGVQSQLLDELHEWIGQYTAEEARTRLHHAMARLTVPQEGGRDVFIFITLGIAGRSLSDKIAFGSAVGVGSATATSFYIGQQSFFGALWAQWFGAPAWVAASGAAAGFLVMLMVTPAIAPLTEFGINRIRAKAFLHEVVDQVEHNVLHTGTDATSVAGHIGSYLQLLPDLLQILKSLR